MGITRSTSFLTDEMNKAHTAFMKANKSNVMTLNNQNTLLLEYQRMLVDDNVSMTKILSFILHDNRIYVFERFIPKPKDDRDLELASCTRPISQPFRPISGEIPDSSNPLHPSSRGRKESNVSVLSGTDGTTNGTWKEMDQGKEVYDTAVSTPAKDLIQNILTSPGFRLLTFMYLFFQLVDDSTFIAIVVSTIYHGATSSGSPSGDTYSLYFVIGLEIFYDILLAVNKYWILQRVSVFIALSLFVSYFTILNEIRNNEGMSDERYRTLTALLLFRFFFFLFEECIDVYIDCSIHNILLTAQHCRDNNIHLYEGIGQSLHLYQSVICEWYFDNRKDSYHCVECGHIIPKTWFPSNICNIHSKRITHIQNEHSNYYDYIEKHEKLALIHHFKHAKCMIPEEYRYKGSFFAWSLYSIYAWGNEDQSIYSENDFNQYFNEWRYLLIIVPAFLSLIIAFHVWVLALSGITIMIFFFIIVNFLIKILKRCCKGCYPYQTDIFNFQLFRFFLKELKRI